MPDPTAEAREFAASELRKMAALLETRDMTACLDCCCYGNAAQMCIDSAQDLEREAALERQGEPPHAH